ncbi:MAG: hypothetical protein GF309_15970 [Candidatus Lokiarchaeota archaeon]|nr:hypothetical protein [Candidatus Lokiarchaeota archaeon]
MGGETQTRSSMSILLTFSDSIYCMCGRFSLLAHQKLLRERFNIDRFDHVPDKLYNIDSEQEIAVIIVVQVSIFSVRCLPEVMIV